MCLPKVPKIPQPIQRAKPVLSQKAAPVYGAEGQELGSDGGKNQRKKGTTGFKVDLQTADTKSGLQV